MAHGSSSSWNISLLLLFTPPTGNAQLALSPGGGAFGFSNMSGVCKRKEVSLINRIYEASKRYFNQFSTLYQSFADNICVISDLTWVPAVRDSDGILDRMFEKAKLK